ncbi:MAG: hypothetical protein WC683_20585, partial [bacterium]
MTDQTVQTAEEQIPTLAEILEKILEIVQSNEEKLAKVTAAHEELDREIHEDFFGPLHERYTAQVRGEGIEALRQKHGSRFDPLAEPLKAFGIDDVYERLYDAIEELKKGEGYKPEDEGPFIDGIFNQAMERISKVRGEPPKTEEPPKEEPPAVTETTVEVKGEDKPPEPPKEPPRKKKWSPAMDL